MHIPDLAKSLINRYGTNDPFLLCEYIGIPIIKLPLPESVNGFYRKNGERSCIVISDRLGKNESRLCCAHELGHALLHENTNSLFLSKNTFFSAGKFENQADTFAVFLLFEDASDLYERLGIGTIDQIADYYGIDKKTAELRYQSY